MTSAQKPPADPIPMLLTCPACSTRHVDAGEFATKPHHTHACQFCGMTWRPAIVPTVGVLFLPGFKDEPPADPVAAAFRSAKPRPEPATPEELAAEVDKILGDLVDGWHRAGRCEECRDMKERSADGRKTLLHKSIALAGVKEPRRPPFQWVRVEPAESEE